MQATPFLSLSSPFERLQLLVNGYLRYVETDVFPGGCFFASVLAEVDTQPGPVRDRLAGFLSDWLGELETTIRAAQTEGTLDPGEDPADLTFEIEAALILANAQHVVSRSPEPVERARRIITRRIAATATAQPPRQAHDEWIDQPGHRGRPAQRPQDRTLRHRPPR